VISPLVYIFAGAAGVLTLFFVASAVLTYRHASTRSERAQDLHDYLAAGVPLSRRVTTEEVVRTHKERARVMHITIGDLIRDEQLAVAAAEGVRAAGEGRWTPIVRPFFRIDRTESGEYLVEVRPPGGQVIRSQRETEAEARAWAEEMLARFPFQGESGPGNPD
jgi:hypothetical protein